MSQEIIYTSAPQGLRPGSRGFCTVASTPGMAKNLASRLESLSGYRHAYMPHEADAELNPVNYSHLIIKLAGKQHHVLSRIANAGLDYTQRSNKLAHHVALEPSELTAAGPAWVLADQQFCETTWEGDPRILPAGRRPRTDRRDAQACARWAAVTGDAGWAGVLAESALKPGRPFSVIFAPGTETLELVVESLALLPAKCWEVTFSTYFTKLPAGVDCQWRFVLDGTADARVLRRNPHAPCIDLCSTLGKAAGGELVEAARTGRLPQAQQKKSRTSAARRPDEAPPTPWLDIDAQRWAANATPATSVSSNAPRPAPRTPRRSATVPSLASSASPVSRRFTQSGRHRQLLTALVVMGLFFLVTTGIIGAYMLARNNVPLPTPVAEGPRNDLPIVPQKRETEQLTPDAEPSDADPLDLGDIGVSGLSPEASTPQPVTDSAADPEPVSEPEPARAPRDAFADIDQRGRLLALPPASSRRTWEELAKVYAPASDCRLILPGDRIVIDGGLSLELRQDDSEAGIRTWNVELVSKNSFGGDNLTVGGFRLKNESLQFRWAASNDVAAARLRYSRLEVAVGGITNNRLCALGEPERGKPLNFSLDTQGSNVDDIPVPPGALPKTDDIREALRMDLGFSGFQGPEMRPIRGLLPNGERRMVELKIPDVAKSLNPTIEVEVRFEWEKQQPRLQFELFAFPPGRSTQPSQRTRFTSSDFPKWRVAYVKEKTPFEKKRNEVKRDLDIPQKKLKELLEKLEVASKPPDDETDRAKEQRHKRIRFLQREIDEKESFISELKRQEEQHRRAIEELDNRIAWCDKIGRLDEQLTEHAQVHYKLYFFDGNERIELSQSRSD